jgi:hypothetical protein
MSTSAQRQSGAANNYRSLEKLLSAKSLEKAVEIQTAMRRRLMRSLSPGYQNSLYADLAKESAIKRRLVLTHASLFDQNLRLLAGFHDRSATGKMLSPRGGVSTEAKSNRAGYAVVRPHQIIDVSLSSMRRACS